MSKLLEEAREVLLRAEQEIQSLIRRAVELREYEEVPNLAGLAQRLSLLITENTAQVTNSPSACPTKTDDGRMAKGEDLVQVTSTDRTASAEDAIARTALSDHYPRYSRKDNALVKTALSSDGVSTYEHRVGKVVLDAILQRMAMRLHSKRSLLTAESLSDMACKDGHCIPSYQIYLVLGWLKREGILRQHGRKGYSSTRSAHLGRDAEHAWCKLGDDV